MCSHVHDTDRLFESFMKEMEQMTRVVVPTSPSPLELDLLCKAFEDKVGLCVFILLLLFVLLFLCKFLHSCFCWHVLFFAGFQSALRGRHVHWHFQSNGCRSCQICSSCGCSFRIWSWYWWNFISRHWWSVCLMISRRCWLQRSWVWLYLDQKQLQPAGERETLRWHMTAVSKHETNSCRSSYLLSYNFWNNVIQR